MGEQADRDEEIFHARELEAEETGVEYDPLWFFPSRNPTDPESTEHVCKDWPCATCNAGF
jgi:hypothetical protein